VASTRCGSKVICAWVKRRAVSGPAHAIESRAQRFRVDEVERGFVDRSLELLRRQPHGPIDQGLDRGGDRDPAMADHIEAGAAVDHDVRAAWIAPGR